MSFGFSVGDVNLLGHLAWKIVQNTREACGEDDERTWEISHLHVVLRRLEREVQNPASPINRGAEGIRDELLSITNECEEVLRVLDKIFVKYNALDMRDRNGRKLWQGLQLDDGQMIDLAGLRKNVKYYTMRLSIFLDMEVSGIMGRESANDGMDEARRGLSLPAPRLALNDVVARYLSELDSESLTLTNISKEDTVLWDDLQTELLSKGYPETAKSGPMHLMKASVKRFLLDNYDMRWRKDAGIDDPDLPYVLLNSSDETPVGPVGVNTSTAYPMQRMTVQPRDEPFQQESWLPFSELAVGPHIEQYSNLQHSSTAKIRRFARSIRPCHIFIFLGVLTILGSLIPAIWRSVARDDISGGFSLAQYILGVGVFVIGCMVAVHSKSCTCWQ